MSALARVAIGGRRDRESAGRGFTRYHLGAVYHIDVHWKAPHGWVYDIRLPSRQDFYRIQRQGWRWYIWAGQPHTDRRAEAPAPAAPFPSPSASRRCSAPTPNASPCARGTRAPDIGGYFRTCGKALEAAAEELLALDTARRLSPPDPLEDVQR
jgi:hypothetical protein